MEMNSTQALPLVAALQQLKPHDHLCSIYESTAEHFMVAVAFIKVGLSRGEKCIYIADQGKDAAVREAMQAAGIDVERAIANGSLVLETIEAAYLKKGSFGSDWMFQYWPDATAEAMRQGFSALRGTGETEWVTGNQTGRETWLEYERGVTSMLGGLNCILLCQYDRRLFSPDFILDLIRTHPTIVFRGVVCRNMYHVPPDELLGDNPSARELEHLLTSIREREAIEYTLRHQRDEVRRSEDLLRLVLDTLSVGVAVVNPVGDVILSNSASKRIWGRSIRSGAERYAESKAWWHATGEMVAPDEWASVRAIQNGETSVNEVLEIESFDGIRKIIQNSAVPIKDTNERITGAVIINEDISARTAAERELSDSYHQMRALTGRLIQAQDDERRRIAKMLHETTAQDLAALKMHLARLNRTVGHLNDSDRDALKESISLAEQSIAEIRTLSYLLHPPFLDEMGLLSALRWFAAGFAERSGIKVDLDLPESFERLPLDTETALFRIVQESLTNIHRHSGSVSAGIQLRHRDGEVVVAIRDRGRGIPPVLLEHIMRGGSVAGVGVARMSERMEQLGGHLEIESTDQGTTVHAQLPLMLDAD